MDLVLSALLIFSMRVADVSIGTVRIVTLVQGRRFLAGGLGFFESLIWILAASQVIGNLDDPVRIVGYAGGFAAGTVLGSTIERWIGMGKALVRVVAEVHDPPVASRLRELGFGATVLNAEGLEGPVRLTFTVIPRRRTKEVLGVIRAINPDAFVTVESTTTPDFQGLRLQRV
jgi:uncharacterized protein YebE (UPF0316 family)